ncbi:MAG: hypothetical protein HXX81_02330 [Campylobacterales bacterium]|nr:hypothetical protein [Campylobacterales bacterium]
MNKDVISKEAIKTLVIDIAKYILEIEINQIEFLDKELQRIEDRRADIVAKIDNSYILHLEIQNSNDKYMHLRMLRYFTDISFLTDMKIVQYVVYIGKEKLNMKSNLTLHNINYNYNLIDMKNIDCEKLISLDTPDSLVLAILCDFKDKNADDIINFILRRLYEKTKENETEFKKYMLMLEELSENRNLIELVKKGEEMLSQINYEKLPSYYLGLERGIERGIEKGIERGKSEAKIDYAHVMIELGIAPEIVANKLQIPLEELLKNR